MLIANEENLSQAFLQICRGTEIKILSTTEMKSDTI